MFLGLFLNLWFHGLLIVWYIYGLVWYIYIMHLNNYRELTIRSIFNFTIFFDVINVPQPSISFKVFSAQVEMDVYIWYCYQGQLVTS